MKSAVPVAIANEANGAIGKITGFISLLLYCSATRKHTREWSYFYLQVLSDSLLHGDCHIATFWWWFPTVWQCNKTCVPWLLCLGVVLYLTSVSLWSSIPLPTVSLKIHLQLSLSKKIGNQNPYLSSYTISFSCLSLKLHRIQQEIAALTTLHTAHL